MRLVKLDGAKSRRSDAATPPPDYKQQQKYKALEQLLYRVIQLEEIRDHHCTCGMGDECACSSDKMLELKQKIWRAQKELDRLYRAIEGEAPLARH